MKERCPEQQPRSATRRNEEMKRFWHAGGVATEQASAERVRRMTLSNRERAVIASVVIPLALRGATTEEIHKIQGIKPSQINNALTKARRKSSLLPSPTEEETRRAKRLAHLGKRMREARKYTQEEENAFVLAKKLISEGVVGYDLSGWRHLHSIYEQAKRDLPDSFAKCLRLEVFLRTQLNANNGNRELMDKYVEWGLEIDTDWFGELAAEEEFITRTVGEKRDKDEIFLDEFLRARKEFARTGDIRLFNELQLVIKQDPTIKTRLAPQMAEIVQATPEINKNNHHGAPIVNGEMSWDDIMGR